ncbi:MAG: serine/threonine protein kinase [Planctomycetes bacterium]|nr:serine/threonine protein kinase [Planctomycetota bacterium]
MDPLPLHDRRVTQILECPSMAAGRPRDSDPALSRTGGVSRYAFLARLQQTQMATLSLARDRKLNRLVALKQLAPRAAMKEGRVRRFLREIDILSRLRHPHVVALYDAGEWDGLPFFVMDYIPGQDFERFLRLSRPLRTKLSIVARVARAVAYIHQRGVIHRDLKPANILVDDVGEPYLIDFGLARMAGEERDPDSLTRPGEILGTPLYMPPEQLAGKTGEMGARSDIFALGLVLYEAATGEGPGRREVPFRATRRLRRRSIFGTRERVPGVPDTVYEIALRAMRRRPEERTSNALEIAAAIEGILPGLGDACTG